MRFDGTLAADADVRAQRHVDAFLTELPFPLHQREITFLDLTFTHQSVQCSQRRGFTRDQQKAACVPVNAMDQFERLVRSRSAQAFDHAEAHPAAAMHCDAGGFIDDDEARIFVNDRPDERGNHRRRCMARRCRCAGPHRWNSHDVARLQPGLGFGAFAVHAHLAFADHPEDVRLWNTFEIACKKVVQPLTGALLAGGQLLHFHERCRRFNGLPGGQWARRRHRWFVTSCFH